MAPTDPERGPGAGVEAGRRLRLTRLAAGLSQAELARRCGVSRQAVAGAEAGSWSPSLAVALALARALGTTVDRLFAEARSPEPVAATALDRPAPGGRARLARVWDRWVGLPLAGDRAASLGFSPASGRLRGEGDLAEPWGRGLALVVAGCDPALPLLSGSLAALGEGWAADWWACSSAEAARLLREGLVHAGAVHRPRGWRQASAREPELATVGFAGWREGLLLRAEHRRRISSVEDALEAGLRWVNREPGAEARALLDSELGRLGAGSGDLPGYRSQARGHLQVASTVRSGAADVGVATEPAALAQGLEFIPLTEEECLLQVERSRLDTPELRLLLQALAGSQLRRELEAIPGYDP
ncbi:MAG: substrate-binding domain-containing protein, partial [Candidatus Dormibacteria bacterium]